MKGFIQTCDEYGYDWLTWVESPTVADKRAKDTEFQMAFEKWALAKFLKLVFGVRVLPISLPRHGSERDGFGNGCVSVGRLNVEHRWSSVTGLETDLPDDYVIDFLPNRHRAFTEEELERLYELLTQR